MQRKTLVFTACYNERENIGLLIDQIATVVPDADLLVVDDNSPDGTWEILEAKKRTYPQLTCVKRPRKLGIGSAHKYALLYAMREGYSTLVTMDADFSHDPHHIPALLAAHGPKAFVTGSRYCEGGKSDYTGYRNLVSRLGNIAARWVLGVKLRELTTYFRVFDVQDLARLPLRRVSAEGYSYGVQLIYYLRKLGVELREVPIHFVDRTRGASKIPRAQILWSALDLIKMGAKRLNRRRDLQPDEFAWDPCANCGDRVLAMKHFGQGSPSAADPASASAAYRCTSVVGGRSFPAVYACMGCGLEQVPTSATPSGPLSVEARYENVVDHQYLENAAARRHTFRKSFDEIERHLKRPPGTLLEVGAYCGLFMQEAKRRGWEADGIEPSKWAAAYARDDSNVNVLTGYLRERKSALRERYDVVVSWDVMEHVRDPAAFVRECGEMLSPEGVFCFSTLDIDSWFPQLMGTSWPWLMDMHLFYFDRRVIADLLARNGFELIDVRSYTHFSRAGYALKGLSEVLPSLLGKTVSGVAAAVPASFVIPVSFGDIKLYVARPVRDR